MSVEPTGYGVRTEPAADDGEPVSAAVDEAAREAVLRSSKLVETLEPAGAEVARIGITDDSLRIAEKQTQRLCHELDIKNVDHIVLWLENQLGGHTGPLAYIACRILDAHEASAPKLPTEAEWLETLHAFTSERSRERLIPLLRARNLIAPEPDPDAALREAINRFVEAEKATNPDLMKVSPAALAQVLQGGAKALKPRPRDLAEGRFDAKADSEYLCAAIALASLAAVKGAQ